MHDSPAKNVAAVHLGFSCTAAVHAETAYL